MLFRLFGAKTYPVHLFLLPILVACATKLNVPGTENITHLKHYSGFSVPASRSYWTNAGIKLEAGDKLLILASGTVKIEKWPGRNMPKFGPS